MPRGFTGGIFFANITNADREGDGGHAQDEKTGLGNFAAGVRISRGRLLCIKRAVIRPFLFYNGSMFKKLFLSSILIATAAFLFSQKDVFYPAASLFSKKETKKCALEPRAREFKNTPYYTGPIIDGHLHLPSASSLVSSVSAKMGLPTPAWDKNLTLEYVNCLFQSEGYTKAYGFHLFTKYSAGGEVKIAKEMDKKYPGKFIHFLMPALVSSWVNTDVSTIKKTLEKNPGLFKGIGEIKSNDGSNLDSPYLMELYELAKKHNLVVMVHPHTHQRDTIEKIIAQYPEVKFYLHGVVSADGPAQAAGNLRWLTGIFERYPNVYYSVDVPLPFYGFKKEHLGKAVPKEETLPRMRADFSSDLQSHVALWKTTIETYPDRILLETDRWHRPHFEPEVSGLIAEFLRSFIGRLDPAVQEKFAYKNAELLLKK